MRRLLVMGLAITWAVLTGAVQAQVKFASSDQTGDTTLTAKGIAFQDAKDLRTDLKHGTLVSLKLNDGTKVTGHVVRLDAKTKRLYLRTRAGEAPVAYAENDLKQIEKATREVDVDPITRVGYGAGEWRDLPGSNGLQESDSGTIRIKRNDAGTAIKPAALNRRDDNKIKTAVEEPNLRIQNVVEPEITKQVSYNGTQRSVVYISSTVSPGEREILDQLQKAENDLMGMTNLKEQREQAIALEMSMQEERVKNQRLVNITMQNENLVNYPYPQLTEIETIIPGPHLYGTRIVTPSQAQKGVITQLPQVLPGPTVMLDRLPAVDPQAYAKAREEYLQLLRTQAFFEDGRLVAVAVK